MRFKSQAPIYRNLSIPIPIQDLKICQSQRSRFSPTEAVPYPGARGDAEGVKTGDAGSGKDQILNRSGYKSAYKQIRRVRKWTFPIVPLHVIALCLIFLGSVYYPKALAADEPPGKTTEGWRDRLREFQEYVWGSNKKGEETTHFSTADTISTEEEKNPQPQGGNLGSSTSNRSCAADKALELATFAFVDWINMSRLGRPMSYTKKHLLNNNLCFVHFDNQKEINVWVQPYGFHANYQIESKKDPEFELSLNTFGIEGGGERTFWDHLTIGGVAGYLHSHFDNVNVNGFYLGPFIGGLFPKGFASFSLIGGRNTYSGKSEIFKGKKKEDGGKQIDHYSRDLLFRFEGGYDHQLPESFMKEFYLHPEILIDYLKVFESSYSYVHKQYPSFFRSLTALRISKTVICKRELLLAPTLTLGWVYLKPLSNKKLKIKKCEGKRSFELEEKSKNQFALGGEIVALIKTGIVFILHYEGNFGRGASVQEGKVRVEWSW